MDWHLHFESYIRTFGRNNPSAAYRYADGRWYNSMTAYEAYRSARRAGHASQADGGYW